MSGYQEPLTCTRKSTAAGVQLSIVDANLAFCSAEQPPFPSMTILGYTPLWWGLAPTGSSICMLCPQLSCEGRLKGYVALLEEVRQQT